MKNSLRTRAALFLADWLHHRADELRRELQDHVRGETHRIALADRRARGLRLYAAWSGARRRTTRRASAALKTLPATA